MKLSNIIIKTSTLAIVAGLIFSPICASAGQFRGANAGDGQYLIDLDGDGIGDVQPAPGTGAGRGAENFIDTDNNGICDTYENGGLNIQDGSGSQGFKGGRTSMLDNTSLMLAKGNGNGQGQGNGNGTKQQKKDGTCQISQNESLNFAAIKKQDRKKDGSCQTSQNESINLAATKQQQRKKDGSCQA